MVFHWDSTAHLYNFSFLLSLTLVHLPWIILGYYYFRQRRFKKTIEKIIRHGKMPMAQRHIIDTISDEVPDTLSIKTANGFSFLKLLAVTSGVLQTWLGLFALGGLLYSTIKSLSILIFMSYSILFIFLLCLITLINGLLALYQITVINRAAKKIEQARAESDRV